MGARPRDGRRRIRWRGRSRPRESRAASASSQAIVDDGRLRGRVWVTVAGRRRVIVPTRTRSRPGRAPPSRASAALAVAPIPARHRAGLPARGRAERGHQRTLVETVAAVDTPRDRRAPSKLQRPAGPRARDGLAPASHLRRDGSRPFGSVQSWRGGIRRMTPVSSDLAAPMAIRQPPADASPRRYTRAMDLHVIGPLASPAERAAVDAVLGPAESGWHGAGRDARPTATSRVVGMRRDRGGTSSCRPSTLSSRGSAGSASPA